jgi:hypothetical protein
MEDRIDRLFQEWHRLGGAVLVSQADDSVAPRPAEEVIAESTALCRDSGRLTWVTLDWLIRHSGEIDERKLLRETRERGDLSVLGLLCDAAYQRNPDPAFDRLMRSCMPHSVVTPFFHRVARSPLASRLAAENALDIFRRWNYVSNELRYL